MRTALMIAALGMAACATQHLPDIEGQETISQGVYGQLVNGCDTPDCSASVAAGTPVFVFDERPDANTQAFSAMASSNGEGLYQVSLAAGTYSLCRGYFNDQPSVMKYFFGPCVEVTVGTKVRRDWASGPGGGHWSGGDNFFPRYGLTT